MKPTRVPDLQISPDLVAALKAFAVERAIEHCGLTFAVAPFAFYADCPACGTRMKVRSCSGVTEIEDVFDAVFEWLTLPKAAELAQRRLLEIAADRECE